MKRVYLDSNVLTKLIFGLDAYLRKILEAARKRKIIAYISWLSLSEVSRSVTGEEGEKLQPRIGQMLRKNKIVVLSTPE